jgi:hypothetical protein
MDRVPWGIVELHAACSSVYTPSQSGLLTGVDCARAPTVVATIMATVMKSNFDTSQTTLLQLDSTFTERDYGASTFRDFIEKMAAAGYVNLKQVDRSLLVELKDVEGGQSAPAAPAVPHAEDEDPPQPSSDPSVTRSPLHSPSRSSQQHVAAQPAPPPLPQGPATPAQIEEE